MGKKEGKLMKLEKKWAKKKEKLMKLEKKNEKRKIYVRDEIIIEMAQKY